MKAALMPGIAIGTITWRSTWSRLQPSIRAARSTSMGSVAK